jgi:signal transduction histidine kinase
MKRWRLNSITARIAFTLVLAIILGIALSVGTNYVDTRLVNPRPNYFVSIGAFEPPRNAFAVSGTVAAVARILAQASEAERQRIIAAMTDSSLQLVIRDAPVPNLSNGDGARLDHLRELIELQLGDQTGAVIVARGNGAGDGFRPAETLRATGIFAPADVLVEIALPDGHWLVAHLFTYPVQLAWLRVAMTLTPMLIAVALLSAWTARRLAAPIRAFAAGAERLGKGTDAPALAEQGPYELRAATAAFNRMQQRLRRFVNDRTQMVAAMSHDLKTPLTRLRLRAEFVGDEEQQRRMLADLDEMTAMIESTLAFARDDAQREPRMLVDLGALLGSVCDNASDTGGAVSCSAPRGLDVTCRPSAISRAVTNLIDNAVKYGGGARANLDRAPGRAIITIDDDGPGIPMAEREKVFAPFYRLEGSRNRDTGGVGLGLAVARTIAREHGGDITLATAEGGGLRARLELPA